MHFVILSLYCRFFIYLLLCRFTSFIFTIFFWNEVGKSFFSATLGKKQANLESVALLFQSLRVIFSVKKSVMLKKKRDAL